MASVRAIKSSTLVLEPQVAGHAEEMFAILSDPAIYQHENAPPQSLDWLRSRYARLESRRSTDGGEQWLNWVIRLPTSEVAGYVQATVRGERASIAYELASVHWGRGLAYQAVDAMIAELAARYRVRNLFAVLKRSNVRSLRLLRRLGFSAASAELLAANPVEAGELLMTREC